MTVSSTPSSTANSASTGTVLTADQLLAKAKGEVDASQASANGVLSPADLLQRAQERAQGIVPTDTVDLSQTAATASNPVQKALDAAAAAKKVQTTSNYTDQDWFIKAKVAQLKQQITIYTGIPGLDPSGAMLDSLTKQVNDLVTKQKAKLKVSTDAAAAAQKQADASKAASANAPPSSQALLNKVQGTAPAPSLSADVSALLAKAKARGSSVNTSA